MDITKIKIERGVEIPTRTSHGKWVDLILRMQELDSIVLTTNAQVSTFRATAKRHGIGMIKRKVDGGWRIWKSGVATTAKVRKPL